MTNQKINRRLREINELEKLLEKEKQKLIKEKINLQNKCKHTIVIKASDRRAHKVGPIYIYLCPICGKIGHTYPTQDISKTHFENSKIINITSLNYEEYENFFTMAKEEILSNYDYYFNPNIPAEELSESIIERINLPISKKIRNKSLKKEETYE